ncbi:CdaR family protein [Mesonia aestuariivivens]|uniref:YbbR-like domain-containing protein n=1 Tax=Mesonia aestuariivivens TaxID=2796128 RepID=A0ABS6W203_9FLAO|nr:CdaR family protein [Mesonia aestuariivivens]MBW2961183.1 YbbR-like domain-containing protein [Mesonia aestuariivivens]
MKNIIKKLRSTVFKKTNFKAFFFFLCFSVVIWILVQFSKNYKQSINVEVEYVNTPKDKIIHKNKDEFSIRLNENGFNIAWFSISKPIIQVDLGELPEYKKELIFVTENHKQELQDQLDIDIDEVTFLKDTLGIPYEQKKVRKIPIKSRLDISYAPGYSSNEVLKLQPDSVKVSGPSEVIDSLKAVYTKQVTLTQVKHDLNGKIGLDTLDAKGATFYTDAVEYELKVEKFTEGRAEVPIEVINAPRAINLSIFPKRIVVIYVVSLENYKSIVKGNFKVVCDYKDLKENQNFLIPKLVEKPKNVTSTRLNINKVQFVIKK